MKKLFWFLILMLSIAASAAPSDYVPHLDKAFLHAPAERDDLVASLTDDLKPFCEHVAQLSDEDRLKVNLAARESCQLEAVVRSLDASEQELQIRNGEPVMMRALTGSFDEAAVWRYFIRTQKLHRLLSSLRIYFSQAAGINKARVGLIGIPVLAASLDNYSYWTRLIAMKDSMYCPPENQTFCQLIEPQLASLARASWPAIDVPDDLFALDEKKTHLLTVANAVKTRISQMTLGELSQLEKMQNVTSAGLGIPYFRQILARLNIQSKDMTPIDQQKLQRAILLSEIRDAFTRWHLTSRVVAVTPESVRQLSGELQMVVNETGSIL